MRILVVTQYFWPENFRINDLVTELAARGHEITVLTGKPNYPAGQVFAEYRRDPKAFSQFGKVQVFRVPMLARGSGGFQLALNYLSFVLGACLWGPGFLRGRDFDVVFVFEPSPVTVGLPAVLLGRLKRIPVVFWALDLWPETLSALGVLRSPRAIGWVGLLVRFLYDRCALVLGQSRGFLPAIAKYCKDPRKVRYFPSWAEDVFSGKPAEKAAEIPVVPGTFNILFAGNLGEAQDLPAIVEAAEKLRHRPEIRWLIVGDGRKSAWLADEIERRGLQTRMLMAGRFPVERMPSFYAHADALLATLKKDPVFSMTIPGKVQSYLMSGIPLLGMLDGEGARVIEEAEAGYACPAGDADALAANVLRLASLSDEQRKAAGEKGRAYACREFGRDMLIGRLEGMLAEVIDSHKHSPATTLGG